MTLAAETKIPTPLMLRALPDVTKATEAMLTEYLKAHPLDSFTPQDLQQIKARIYKTTETFLKN